MSRCEHCIARQLNSMKSLSKKELKLVTECKTTKFYKKGDVIFNEDYANIVGTATESVIRILSQFKKEGLISTKGKQIKIENLQDLKFVK